MKNILIFIATLAFYNQLAVSHILSEEAMKYWYYRDRLKYFVYPEEEGASVLMTSRNSNGYGDYVRQYKGTEWGQTRKINGYYIGLLATEYKLLKENGQTVDANSTLQELNLALEALIRMDNCEDDIPW